MKTSHPSHRPALVLSGRTGRVLLQCGLPIVAAVMLTLMAMTFVRFSRCMKCRELTIAKYDGDAVIFGNPTYAGGGMAFPTLKIFFPDNTTRLVSANHFGHSGWWLAKFGTWHQEVFIAFDHYLSSGRYATYIGVGEWIGPTVLFAAPRVKRAFAVEADPSCTTELRQNVAANPDVGRVTHVSSFCISGQAQSMKIRGTCDSISFVEGIVDTNFTRGYVENDKIPVSEVSCIPFASFVNEFSVDLPTSFIKMDTEGAEWSIIPSMFDLISAIPAGSRPTLFLSIHDNNMLKEANMEAFVAVLRLFRYGAVWNGLEDGPLPITTPSSTGITPDVLRRCSLCDIIVSDAAPERSAAAPQLVFLEKQPEESMAQARKAVAAWEGADEAGKGAPHGHAAAAHTVIDGARASGGAGSAETGAAAGPRSQGQGQLTLRGGAR